MNQIKKTRKPNKVPQKYWLNKTQTNEQIFRNEQTKILKIVDSIMPREAKPVNDRVTGVDYKFFETTIDRKFGFFKEGTDSIKVRIQKGELINASDYTMILHRDRIEIFPTKKIRDYMKKHPEKIMFDSDLHPRIKKGKVMFHQARIKISDLYKQEKITPSTIVIPLEKIAQGKARLKLNEAGKMQTIMKRALERIQILNQLKNIRTNQQRNSFFEKYFKIKNETQIKSRIRNGKINKNHNNHNPSLRRR